MNEYTKLPAKKSLGQHFLTSPVVPTWMCDAANLVPGDIVVEIGPGTGVLTKEILKRGAIVIALEADPRAVDILTETFTEAIAINQLTVIHADVRTFNLAHIETLKDHQFKVVANIPYYLSGLLFRSFLETSLQPSTLVYLVQKEVAKRACSELSRHEKESLLSLSVKVFGDPSFIRSVSRGHFTPPPKVDSGIIAINHISRKNFTQFSEAFFFTVLRLGFGQKRKQLLGNLSTMFKREVLLDIFTALCIPLTVRGEDVPLETWLRLCTALNQQTDIHRQSPA
jgi:16S rRNA (adenine1518-N6/adenine1519-N6)-dimethyltransferase